MRSPAEYEAEHAAGDPDGLARASSSAGAREKAVHNSEDALAAFGFGLTECTTDPGRVSVSKDVSSGPGRRFVPPGGAGWGVCDLIGPCLRKVPRHFFVRPPRPSR